MFDLQQPRHIPTLPWLCKNAKTLTRDKKSYSSKTALVAQPASKCRPRSMSERANPKLLHRSKRPLNSNTSSARSPHRFSPIASYSSDLF